MNGKPCHFFVASLAAVFLRISYCTGCQVGEKKSATGACKPCASGRFSSSPDSATCQPCPNGQMSPSGAAGCCPSDSDDWPATPTVSLNLPPGKLWTDVFLISGCTDDAIPDATWVQASPASQTKVDDALHLATIIRGKAIHSCKSFQCPRARCSVVAPDTDELMPGHFLSISASVQVSAMSSVASAAQEAANGDLLYECPIQARVGFTSFGCEEGTILAFLGALLVILSGTIILGLLFEFLFRRRTDFFVQASLKIMAARSEAVNANNPVSALWPLPTLRDLHTDIQGALMNTLSLPASSLPGAQMHAWVSGRRHASEDKADAVHVEFRIPRKILSEVDALRKQLLGLAWMPGESWATSDVVVELQPPACVKEVGALPGADLMDAIEGCVVNCLSCCSRNGPDLGDRQLHLIAARQILATLMTRRMAVAIFFQTIANLAMIGILPGIASLSMTCEDGFPAGIHAVWGIYILFSCIFGTWIIIQPLLFRSDDSIQVDASCRTSAKKTLIAFISKHRVRIFLRFIGMLVSVTDLYQDTSFPVIAAECGFDMWWVSVWLVFLGVVVMQIVVQLGLMWNCWRRYKRARTAEERERIHIEGIFLALRGCDNHVLVYAAKPAIEERLGGASSWAIKTVEARVAFLRFVFEDAEQSALQVIFLYWFENASLHDKLWVAFSVSTSLLLSFCLTVQTLPEVRDWIWFQFLTAFPGGARLHRRRFMWLFLIVALYRLLSVLPWLGACTPAGDYDAVTLKRLFLMTGGPPSIVITEVFAGCALALAVALFMTAISAWVWRKPLGLSRRWHQWRGTFPHAGAAGSAYDFKERLVPDQQMHLKTEQDEDNWLTPLRAVAAECTDGKKDQLLSEIDARTFELVRAIGLSKNAFAEQRGQVFHSLQELEGLSGVSKEPVKALNVEIDRSITCSAVRHRALELLADRTFRQADLSQKAHLIDEATSGQLPLQLLHWSVLAELKQLPRCGDEGPGAVTVDEAEKQFSCRDRFVVVYLSHSWMRRNHPDTEKNLKARTMVQFAQWLTARSAGQGIRCEVFFWVDYSCIDTEVGFEIGMAALPLFVAACTDILTWRTPDYESRCWTMVERLLAYCFCPGGLTPYAVDGTSFGVERMLDAKEEPLETEPSKDFGELYREMTSPTKRAQTVPLDQGETEVQRFVRKLPDPLDAMAVRPSGTVVASTQRRHLQALVDIALAVPALEIFGDRQPVDFGLTEVIEQVLGNYVPLQSGFSGETKRSIMVAWGQASEPVPAGELGKWLMLEGAAVEISEWRLVVELANLEMTQKRSYNFRPGDDEGVITLVDAGNDTDGEPPSPPRLDEIDRLFMEVNMAYEDHLGGAADGIALEKAATALAQILKADLLAALHIAEKDGDESTVRHALMRTRNVELPEKEKALARLCEMQLSAAVAAGDIVGIRMAMRYARQQSFEDLPAYGAAEAALAQLQVEKLRQNALSVVHDEGADLLSIVSVVGVAKQRGWHDIAKEALGVLQGRTLNAEGAVDSDILLTICSEGQNLKIDAVVAMANGVLGGLLEDMKKNKRSKDLVLLLQKWRKWNLKNDMESELLQAIQAVMDYWKENCKEASWAEADAALKAICEISKVSSSSDVYKMAQAGLSHITGIKEHEQKRIHSLIHASPTSAGKLFEAVKVARAWGWEPLIVEAQAAFEQVIKSAAEREPQAAALELSEIFEAAREQQVDAVLDATRKWFYSSSCLGRAKDAKDPVMLMQMLHSVEAKGCLEFAGQVRVALRDVVAYFKDSDLADAEETLSSLHRAADELGEAEIAEMAGEAAEVAASKEEEKRKEAEAILAGDDASISTVVETLGLARRRGWLDIVSSAEDVLRSKLAEVSNSLPMTADELSGLAQAYHLAEQRHVHAGAAPILSAMNSHKQELLNRSDAVGIMNMVCVLEQEKCEKVAGTARQALDSMMSDWKEAGFEHPPSWAPALRDAARTAAGPWVSLADEIDRILKLEEQFDQAKRDKDVKSLGQLGKVFLEDHCTGDHAAVQRFLMAELESWKSAGLEDPPSVEVLNNLLVASEQCGATALHARAQALHQTVHEFEGMIRKMGNYKTEAKVLSDGLIQVVSTGEKLGCAHLAGNARNTLKQLVTSLQKDVTEDFACTALQELHDVARKEKLDDVADLAVEAVGGSLPKDWVTNGSKRLSLLEKIPSTDEELITRIQEMVDATYRGWGRLGADCSTRDRHKLGNPQGAAIKVEQVVHVENAANYLNFIRRRSAVEKEFKALADKGRNPHLKTWQVSFKGLQRYPTDPIDQHLNECWLWHGTSEAGVNGITDTDFDMARAGKHVGTMFGSGIYFTESTLKADEYTKADARGFSPLLLCRVVLGHYYYCDAKAPWDMTETLEKACKGGGYHSILGDRERVRGTYREFVVFDNDQIYPEYIVWYSRVPPFKDF